MKRKNKKVISFVKKAQILMCDFELCCRKSDNLICRQDVLPNIKPEIGKIRPVVIVKPHRRHRLAIVIPFTTQRPVGETGCTLEMPIGTMPGRLAPNKSWALCDMICTINIDRLQRIYRKDLQDTLISDEYFQQIKSKIHKAIG